MKNWPIDLIIDSLDRKVPTLAADEISKALRDGGAGKSLVDFLTPLYTVAAGGTFFGGALRVLPLNGNHRKKSLGLLDWNRPDEWRSSAPVAASQAFYFMSNSFGDLLGVPVGEDLEIAKDRVCILWVDQYAFESSAKAWADILRKALVGEDHMDVFLSRRKDHEWAQNFLGTVKPHESFAWTIPPRIGGPEEIDNITIGGLALNVSFTLQLLRQQLQANQGPALR